MSILIAPNHIQYVMHGDFCLTWYMLEKQWIMAHGMRAWEVPAKDAVTLLRAVRKAMAGGHES